MVWRGVAGIPLEIPVSILSTLLVGHHFPAFYHVLIAFISDSRLGMEVFCSVVTVEIV